MHVYTTTDSGSYLKEPLKHLQPKSFGNMACLLQPHRSGNPAVGWTDWNGKERDRRERERFLPVFIQLCVSGLRVWISVIHIITGIGILKITRINRKDQIAILNLQLSLRIHWIFSCIAQMHTYLDCIFRHRRHIWIFTVTLLLKRHILIIKWLV